MPPSVRTVEVGPRDGLQNISRLGLYGAGLKTIELTSIVSPKAVPQLKDCQDVLKSPPIRALLGDESNRLLVLVPNTKSLK